MRGELPDDYEWACTQQFEEFFAQSPGVVFVDVGAHHGTWTLRLAHLFRHVVSFEPHPISYEALRLEAPANVEVSRFGLSSVRQKASLFLYDSPGHSAIDGSPVMTGVDCSGQLEIDVATLDEWILPGKLDLLKIDTEGHELEVLEGARATLVRDRPCLCIENHSLELRQRTIEFLLDIGIHVNVWPDESRRHPTENGYCIRLET